MGISRAGGMMVVGGVCAGIRPRRLVRLLLLSTRRSELLWGKRRRSVCKWVGHGHAKEREKKRAVKRRQ